MKNRSIRAIITALEAELADVEALADALREVQWEPGRVPSRQVDDVAVTTSDLSDPTAAVALDDARLGVRIVLRTGERHLADALSTVRRVRGVMAAALRRWEGPEPE